ncbi:hypothetical protein HPB51_020520 [Rhipicephalus microplus]|uniref:Uncharacterized protein n=1 Tax=Rhipicephalus microplus TaxID=6941 RepID=A0A9J6EV62_RHIMP|nr:hypothetical protein HPB51_020520 [Rhipicephalus microplus]
MPNAKETVEPVANQSRIVDVLNVEEAIPSTVCGDERTVYLLPNIPLYVKLSIHRHQQGHYFGNCPRVLQWLYNDSCSYRMQLTPEGSRSSVKPGTHVPILRNRWVTGGTWVPAHDLQQPNRTLYHEATAAVMRQLRTRHLYPQCEFYNKV